MESATAIKPLPDMLISLESVGYRYPSQRGSEKSVLQNINISVRRGEVWAIRGRNGTGKTTLLKLIAGQLQPENGSITHHKEPLKIIYMNQLASEFVAPALTVQEQLLVGMGDQIPVFARNASFATSSGIADILDRYAIGLSEKINTFTAELSGGQRQIIALITALISAADILLLDEYTSYMDEISISISNEILRNAVSDNSISIIAVDHGYTLLSIFDNLKILELS